MHTIAAGRNVYDTVKEALPLAKDPVGSIMGGGLSVEVGVSSSSSESRYSSRNESAVGSTIISGGDTTIVARGEDGRDNTGDLTITGSRVEADGTVTLAANNDITLQSAKEHSSHTSSEESSSAGFGVSVGVGLGTPGIGGISVNASASQSKGAGSGSGTTHQETVIKGAEGVEFASVGDTTLQGAQISGNAVTGTVGGNLAIVSEQDTYSEQYDRDSKGGNIGVAIGGGLGGVSAGVNSASQSGESEYASVNEQSGVYAGDGGFDITVGGNTGLTGSVIASEAEAEKNSLITGTLTTDDVADSSEYSQEVYSIGTVCSASSMAQQLG